LWVFSIEVYRITYSPPYRCSHYQAWGSPFLKKDSPTDAPKRHRRPRPTRIKVTQSLARGPGPTSHTPWASASMCGEGEPPRKEHATACASASLHLRRKQRTSFWPGPTSHPPWASASMCGKGEPPLEEHATACSGASFHIRRKQRTSLLREEYATACSSAPLPKPTAQALTRGPGPMSHPP
jgi:hypothetical protein